MNSFVFRYLLIELIRVDNRAVFYTGSTTRTFALINIAGPFSQCYLKIPRFTFYTVNFGIGKYLYIGMPADLDQFG